MSLQNNESLKSILTDINTNLNKYADYRRPELFKQFIHERLTDTLKMYNHQLDVTSDFLLHQEGDRVLKALTKMKKQEDKDVIAQNMIEEK